MGDVWVTKLQPGEVFVFGSNLAGIHGAGAALTARKHFGARYGTGEGLTGQSYAFPTLDRTLRRLPFERMEAARDTLYATCRQHPEKRFYLTKVGCGLAGHPEWMMSSLFTDAPDNLMLPENWGVPLYCAMCDNLAVAPVRVLGHLAVCAAHKKAWDEKEALLDKLLPEPGNV